MKREIPVLFSSAMVDALIADRKTQTRRIMKPQMTPCDHSGYVEAEWKDKPTQWSDIALKHGKAYCALCGRGIEFSKDNSGITCPYGKPEDILYVRETWKMVGWDFEDGTVDIEYADGETLECLMDDNCEWTVRQLEKLQDKGIVETDPEDEERLQFKEGVKHPFSPSIHLPKWCSRIWLEVVNVRVERLQDITENDAIAEGVKPAHCESTKKCPSSLCKEACTAIGEWWDYSEDNCEGEPCYSAQESYETLWKRINGNDSWNSNPWVWVIEFKVLSTTGKPEKID